MASVPGMSSPGRHRRDPITPRTALDLLMAGNRRWVRGQAQHPQVRRDTGSAG
ncbi:MAG: hypothetical protein M3083_17625 [Actinomycetota bacterium]|nr:hypothetical protein [Actinomycetota bacterium]MDQ6948180.1 hypothetical protein [Actinomycetota bacterium]